MLTHSHCILSNLYKEVTFRTKIKWPYTIGDLLKEVKFIRKCLWQDKKRWPLNTGDRMGRLDKYKQTIVCMKEKKDKHNELFILQ